MRTKTFKNSIIVEKYLHKNKSLSISRKIALYQIPSEMRVFLE
jgi:hypothetical protein